MSSSFTEHLSPLVCIVLPLGLTGVPMGPATWAHTGVVRGQRVQLLCCPLFPAQPTLLCNTEATSCPVRSYECPGSQFRKQLFATILYQHSTTQAPQDHSTGTEHARWHCHKTMPGSAAGEQSRCWDSGMVYELTQSTSTTDSSRMRLPQESACISKTA